MRFFKLKFLDYQMSKRDFSTTQENCIRKLYNFDYVFTPSFTFQDSNTNDSEKIVNTSSSRFSVQRLQTSLSNSQRLFIDFGSNTNMIVVFTSEHSPLFYLIEVESFSSSVVIIIVCREQDSRFDACQSF